MPLATKQMTLQYFPSMQPQPRPKPRINKKKPTQSHAGTQHEEGEAGPSAGNELYSSQQA
jgi:hypothetical protein